MVRHRSVFALLSALSIGPVPAILFDQPPGRKHDQLSHVPKHDPKFRVWKQDPKAPMWMQDPNDNIHSTWPRYLPNLTSVYHNMPNPLNDRMPKLPLPSPIPNTPLPQEPCTPQVMFGKELDLIIYGASGFTGKLAAQYLAKGHREHPRWAIAGRKKETVEELFWVELGSNNSIPKRYRHAKLNNYTSLLELSKQTRVILNFAGPFEEIGCENLIRAALQGCAHYIDVSEETHWNLQMLRKYEATAKARKLAIVQSAGFSALASDFLAMSAMNDALNRNKGMPLNLAVVWTRFNDGVSGTQMVSLNNSLLLHGPVKDPYILVPGAVEPQRQDYVNDGIDKYGFSPDFNMTLNKWSNAQIACPVVRRSIATKYPRAAVRVLEAASPELLPERRRFLEDPVVVNENSPVPRHPAVGKGPPYWVQKYGSFAGMAIAITPKGRQIVTLKGAVGPSFAATARMATELALGMSFEGIANGEGGYITPATVLKLETLESRLRIVDDGRFVNITHE